MSARRKPIGELTSWEWETLVAAWRYYEHGHTISSAGFPADICARFFAGDRYAENVREQIAHQFAVTDHGIRGENDWPKRCAFEDCDNIPWCKFFRFCEGYCKGFKTLIIEAPTGLEMEVPAFHVDYTGRWYPVDKYIENPSREIYVDEKSIIAVR